MECMETGADVNDEGEAYVQPDEPVDHIFDEDNGNCIEEDEDNIQSDSNDDVCNASVNCFSKLFRIAKVIL